VGHIETCDLRDIIGASVAKLPNQDRYALKISTFVKMFRNSNNNSKDKRERKLQTWTMSGSEDLCRKW
jgi:hypothetical protein